MLLCRHYGCSFRWRYLHMLQCTYVVCWREQSYCCSLYDPIMGSPPFESIMSKNRLQFFTPAYHLMVMIQGNSDRSTIVSQLFEHFSNASIKIAQLELFLKSTGELMKPCIPNEMKLVSSSKIRISLLNMIYFLSLPMQSLTLSCTL